MIKKILLYIAFLFQISDVISQPNCNLYKWKGDSLCYNACLEATKAAQLPQGSKQSQLLFDKAIALCPAFDYAYFEKSVPYLKRGDFITWKQLIDQAVELNPTQHLDYRGWCRYQFLRDYEGAINDIEKLDSIINYDVGSSINGDYHLNIVKALCYKGLGDRHKALKLMDSQLRQENYHQRLYDYLHFGILKIETGDYKGAIEALEKQINVNDYLADTYFYLARAYKKAGTESEFQKNIQKAKVYYLAGKKRTDPYTEPMDKIYLADIENEMKN